MKKLFSLFMAVMMLISLSACKVNTTSSENGLSSDFSDGEFLVEGTGNDSEDGAASNDGTGSGSGGSDGTVSTPVTPNEGTASMLEGLDFGGKTFTGYNTGFLYSYYTSSTTALSSSNFTNCIHGSGGSLSNGSTPYVRGVISFE